MKHLLVVKVLPKVNLYYTTRGTAGSIRLRKYKFREKRSLRKMKRLFAFLRCPKKYVQTGCKSDRL